MRMRTRLVLASVVPLLLLSGCGDETAIEADPAGTPYDGPMHVERDYSDTATPLKASGAAGLALECTGEPHRGGGGDYVDGGLETVQDSPEEALEDWVDQEWAGVPADGYRVERVDGGRVLLSWDVEERTRVAVVVHDDITDFNDDTGWGVESWSSCDPAELGVDVAEDLGFEVWTDADGRPEPTTDIRSFPGSEHCDWQDITWLVVGQETEYDRDFDTYLSGLADGIPADHLSTEPDTSASLPSDAVATGWQRDGREVWLGDSPRAAYLVSVDDESDVELWPATTERIGCM
jgi:hypothetical protein